MPNFPIYLIQDIDFKPIEETMVAAIRNAETLVKSGFTSSVSAAARGRVDIAIRDAINRGELVGPRLLANGAEVSASGSFVDLHPNHVRVHGLAILSDGEDAVRKTVRSLFKEGADLVKINVSGESLTPHASGEMTLYTDKEVRAAVEEAHARDLEHFVKLVGMTPMEAIVSATKYGGQIMEMEDQIGTIEVGKLADILVVDGDPLKDISILQDHSKLNVILKDGEYIVNTLAVKRSAESPVA